MSVLSHSQTISVITGNTTISHPQNKPIHIKLSKNFVITSETQFFIIGSNNITIEGHKNHDIIVAYAYIAGLEYPGLVRNGTTTTRAYDNITIKHININTSPITTVVLANNAGWIGQRYFGRNAKNVVIRECTNNSIISNYGGGIVGSDAYCIVAECVNKGVCSGINSGGCVGADANSVRAWKCKNNFTGIISGNEAGGIFGSSAVGCIAKNCHNEAEISGLSSGGIFGGSSGSILNQNMTSECKNTGTVSGSNTGGIFGYSHNTSSAYKCYNTGLLTNTVSGSNGIFGNDAQQCTVEACYNTGNIIATASGGGIFGTASSCTIRNCYNSGSLGTVGYGITSDTGGNANLIDHCYVSSLAITGLDPLHVSTITSDVVSNSSDVVEAIGVWKNKSADKYLQGTDGSIWIRKCYGEPYTLNYC